MTRRRWAGLALALVALLAGACTCVRPWQKETLAQPAMREPPWPAVRRGEQHVFEVREASQGAYGASGGGCGCN